MKQLEKIILCLIVLAIGIKILLFLQIAFIDPASIMEADSSGYLKDANAWLQFFNKPSGGLVHSLYRTPGYTFFLAIFHLKLNLSLLSIVFLQLILNLLTAFIVFKTFPSVDRKTALLSAAIILLDLPTTIFSCMILTESLHLLVISIFLYYFINYIQNRRLSFLIIAATFVMISAYIRPVSLFLAVPVAAFILYLWGINKILTGITHAAIIIVFTYGFLGIWQYHNLKTHNEFTFSDINHATINEHGIIGRYSKETDPQLKAMSPPVYYFITVGENFLNLMTTPGNMKYFHSKAWRIFGPIFGYVFVIFWWAGLMACFKECTRDIYLQFLVLVLLYFIAVPLISTGWLVTPRFRVPMIPAIALLSARGWMVLIQKFIAYPAQKS